MNADQRTDRHMNSHRKSEERRERMRKIKEMAVLKRPSELTELWERIYYLCQSANIQQGELAEKIEIGNPHLSGIMNGKSNASISLLKRIASIFEVRVEWLQHGTGNVYIEDELKSTTSSWERVGIAPNFKQHNKLPLTIAKSIIADNIALNAFCESLISVIADTYATLPLEHRWELLVRLDAAAKSVIEDCSAKVKKESDAHMWDALAANSTDQA